jgi:hypothetical protein
MPWIDSKSGFALVGSLVVLAGSIVTRRNSMRKDGPEGEGGSAVPEVPSNPAPASPATYSTVLDHDTKVRKPFRFKNKNPPTASA